MNDAMMMMMLVPDQIYFYNLFHPLDISSAFCTKALKFYRH